MLRTFCWFVGGQRKTTLVSDIDLTCPCNLKENSCDAGCCCDQVLQLCLVSTSYQSFHYALEALLHCAIFCATCLATPLRDKLQESLPNITYLATAKNVAKPVAETVGESRIDFYFP